MNDDEAQSHFPDGLMEPEQAMVRMLETVVKHATYPQGAANPVSVVLTDEQWNSVCAAIQIILIGHYTDGNRLFPDFMADQMHDAYHSINNACQECIGNEVVENLIDEIQKEQG